MRPLFFAIVLLVTAGCANRAEPEPSRALFVTLKAERMPDAANYKTYFLKGGEGVNFASIRWQKLRPQIAAELAKAGLVQVEPSQDADLCLYVEAESNVKLGTETRTRPNIVFTPQTTSYGNAVTYTPKGPVFTQTSVTTPSSMHVAGSTTYEVPTVQSNGFVRIEAYAWKEWVATGAKDDKFRQVWRVFAGFSGLPPSTLDEMTEKMLSWALRHAGTERTTGKFYKTSEDYLATGLPD